MDEEQNNKSGSVSTLIGAVMGGVAVALAVVAGVLYTRYKHHQTSKVDVENQNPTTDMRYPGNHDKKTGPRYFDGHQGNDGGGGGSGAQGVMRPGGAVLLPLDEEMYLTPVPAQNDHNWEAYQAALNQQPSYVELLNGPTYAESATAAEEGYLIPSFISTGGGTYEQIPGENYEQLPGELNYEQPVAADVNGQPVYALATPAGTSDTDTDGQQPTYALATAIGTSDTDTDEQPLYDNMAANRDPEEFGFSPLPGETTGYLDVEPADS